MVETIIIRPSVASGWELKQLSKKIEEGWKIIKNDVVGDRVIYILEK